MWEYVYDVAYFGMWAVRKETDLNENNKELFHVSTKEEAIALCSLLNGKKLGVSGAWNVRAGQAPC